MSAGCLPGIFVPGPGAWGDLNDNFFCDRHWYFINAQWTMSIPGYS